MKCFNFFVRFGYKAQNAYSKWGCVKTLQERPLIAGIKKIFLK